MGTVAEESDEAVFWLELLKNSALGEPVIVDSLLSEALELRAIFASSYGTSRRRRHRKPDHKRDQ
jgi:hypothetical protein